MDVDSEEWARKGATLSDKTARAEFGLTGERRSVLLAELGEQGARKPGGSA